MWKSVTNLKALMTSWIWLPVSPSEPGIVVPPPPLPPNPLLLPDVLCGKPREGRLLSLGPFLLDPAPGFLLITQIRNRCAEAKHLIFIPKCVFFKWQMFFQAKKKKYYYIVFSCNTQQNGDACLQRGRSSRCLNKELNQWSQSGKPFVTV